ncbi:PKD domain-containing protein [Flavihumibacter fluvii]|uniref:PKD domain-containing protein n=1 Tax=Flavihumibacter fluvii TaxID=2838157 RepID=UPI001BDECFA0|nr:PKD domain-containing protein [Flavihumibacter fluvii]ULQ53304.1 PKD domain-containing protein [Flavihumibacter fluvii]
MKRKKIFSPVMLCLLLWITGTGPLFGQVRAAQDTMFNAPYIDIDEWRDKPVRHHYIHGGFKGTDTRFSFYFPPKEKYEGRFFQYITPVPDNENLSQGFAGEGDKIGFSVASGAYFIESNGGGKDGAGMPGSGIDPKIGAYRANAACAQYSRIVAAQLYGPHRTYGYAFGGSGGAYRTIGGLENTDGVWDGAVPYVLGSPMAIPNVFTVRIHAMRILHDKFPQIVDALEPGGSGDMFAGLNDEERQALNEVTRMGFPPRAWFAYKTMGLHAFPVLYPGVAMADSKYFKDFWTLPGYLGADPATSVHKARIVQRSKITMSITAELATKFGLLPAETAGQARGTADAAWKSIGGAEGGMPVGFQLDDTLPGIDFLGGDLFIKSGAAAGKKLFVSHIAGNKIILGNSDAKVLAQIKPGDEVILDNSDFLAAQTYHRHQVPGKEYKVWDQFRDSTGKPIYPQRPMLLGPLFTQAASGVLPNGKFKGKVILLGSLLDSEAFPWQQDWYRLKVKENFGDSTDDHFRIWFTDHANHGDYVLPGDPNYLVSYLGVLQQALRDLSAWVEKGIAPPANTNYKIIDGQVVVPSNAADRKGIQPTVIVKANGSASTEALINRPVQFTAVIDLPANTGKIVSATWDFEGSGTFPVAVNLTTGDFTPSGVTLKTTYTFTKPGIYFPVLRVASQRQGDKKTPYTLIKNLGRMRVVVK